MSEKTGLLNTHDTSHSKYCSLMYYASDAILLTDTEGNLLEANKTAEELTGYTKEELSNMKIVQLHPKEEIERVITAFETGVQKGTQTFLSDLLLLRKDGKTIPVDLTGNVIEHAGKRVAQAIIRDISERKTTERSLAVQYATTRVLVESTTIKEAAPKILQAICEVLNWDFGSLWTVDKQNNVLSTIDSWHPASANIQEFEASTRKITFTPGMGLPGRVWATKKPAWIPDVVTDINFLRSRIAAKEGLHGAFAFPIMSSNEFLGVIDLYSKEIKQPEEDLLILMAAIGNQIGQFIERKQTEEALKYRINFEKTIASISTRFVMLQDFDNAVSDSLAEIGKLRGASRVYLFQLRDDGKIINNTHEWCNEGVAPEIHNLQNLPVSMLPRWMQRLHTGNEIHIPDVSKLPPEAVAEKEFLGDQGIKSLLALPVFTEKKLIGFIGLDNVSATGSWHEDDFAMLRITAEIIGNAIARKQSEAIIKHMAYHDALTDLPNRILFQDRLQMAVIHAKRSKGLLGVVFLDLDSFKTINDSLGHHIGDLLLKAVAGRLTQLVREGDTVARMGGDEFMVILPNLAHNQDAAIVAQKILNILQQPYLFEGNTIYCSVSIGISIYPSDAEDTDSLIKHADIAMYQAKENGKNTYSFFEADMLTTLKRNKSPK